MNEYGKFSIVEELSDFEIQDGLIYLGGSNTEVANFGSGYTSDYFSFNLADKNTLQEVPEMYFQTSIHPNTQCGSNTLLVDNDHVLLGGFTFQNDTSQEYDLAIVQLESKYLRIKCG